MTDMRLSVSGLTKSFDGLNVLDGLSLDVAPGSFVSLLGPSGAGKSTLFKILTGAEKGDGGAVRFDGAPLSFPNTHFAFMPQRDALMPWRRLIDNVTLGLEVQGMKRREAREKVEPLFETFGLAGFERHYPQALSGGMRQRAALMRTVVQQRDMLLLDEPFGALDALTRTAMQRFLEGVWEKERWTALLITHDVREAVYLSDRIYVLSRRPAKVIEAFDVDLPRPRHLADLAGARAREIENQILETLLAEEDR
ncbi:ABC transporter ATP-binding protein [Martelella endophytica]|uniref:ABC transporter ATP-binding protein n=1 Tax=Martelella endophytica TaxID=1486262 RepID=A0A0D5LP89_MAREN|nr:ABC transporter ATP-binding protein [Martelella endophytica]AJY45931.1 ABC transporter ATP-binding protein [Martelella endophytica]